MMWTVFPRHKNGAANGGPFCLDARFPSLLLDLGDVLGGGAFRTLHDVELNPVAFGKTAETLSLDGGVVDKAVLVPVFRSDETKTLRVVEPLHRADGASHCAYSVFVLTARRPVRSGVRVFMRAGLSRVIKN